MNPVHFLLLANLLLAHPFLELLHLCLQQFVCLEHLIHLLHAVPLAQLLGPLDTKKALAASPAKFSPEHPRVHEVDEGANLEDGNEATDAAQGCH